MAKSHSKKDRHLSTEESRQERGFRKRKINLPLAIFWFALFGLIAAAAIWQKSRDPARKDTPVEEKITKRSVEEIDSLVKLEALADEAERRLNDPAVTYVGKLAILEELAATCQRMTKVTEDPEQVIHYKSKELLARFYRLVTCAYEGLDDPVERERVSALIKELEETDDSYVQTQVNLAKLVLSGSALILRPDSSEEFDSLREMLEQLLKHNPNDLRLAAMSRGLIEELGKNKRFPTERWKELSQTIIAACAGTENLSIQTWVRDLTDDLVFEQFGYRDLLTKCEVNAPGAYEEYMATLPRILEARPTPLGYARLLSAGNSFERLNRGKEAAEVYRLIAASVPQPAADELAEVVRACESGQNRLAKIGQRVEISGNDVQGKPLLIDEILGKPALIVYCTFRDPAIKSQLEKVKIDLGGFVRRGMKLIIVCLDGSPEEVSSLLSDKDLRSFRVVADPDRSSVLWQQHSAELLPVIVVLNSVGEVQRFANFDIHLMTTIDGELSKPKQ